MQGEVRVERPVFRPEVRVERPVFRPEVRVERPVFRPEVRVERPVFRPEVRVERPVFRPEVRVERPVFRPEVQVERPVFRPEVRVERPIFRPEVRVERPIFRAPFEFRPRERFPVGRGGFEWNRDRRWLRRPWETRYWGYGMRGERISWLQACLAQVLGPWVVQDGIMGPATQGAIRTFQEQQQLPPTGVLDEGTANALQAACGSQMPSL
jgi:hypothetical protein